MTLTRLKSLGQSLLISIALYPIVLVGVWGLLAAGVVAANLQVPTDSMPLIYGLVFAVLTVSLIDLLGVATVVLALISAANLIEYAQIVIPGREASPVDFIAGLGGVIFAAVLVVAARAFVQRAPKVPDSADGPTGQVQQPNQ